MNVSNYKDRKWYLLSLYGSGGSFSRSGVRISQSLSTQGSSNRQKSIFFHSIMQQRCILPSDSQSNDIAHKFDCYDELRWDQPCA